MKSKIELYGHSGFEVVLYEGTNNNYIVRKKARLPEQNPRISEQYKKLLFFHKLDQDLFSVAKPLGSGMVKGLFFYEYAYVEGQTLIHYIENHDINDVLLVLEKVLKILAAFKDENNFFEAINSQVTLGAALKSKLFSILPQLPQTPSLKKKLNSRLNILENVSHKTICHGDLSFDNIIIDKKNRVWLIDFLDNFYPHYWFDIAKLFADIDGKWYEFKYGIRLPYNKLSYIREYVLQRVAQIDPSYAHHHNFLVATVFLRILPYLHKDSEKQFIIKKINSFLSL